MSTHSGNEYPFIFVPATKEDEAAWIGFDERSIKMRLSVSPQSQVPHLNYLASTFAKNWNSTLNFLRRVFFVNKKRGIDFS